MAEFLVYWKLVLFKALAIWWAFVWDNFLLATVLSLATFLFGAIAKSNRDTISGAIRQWWEAPMHSAHDLFWGGVGVLALIGLSLLVCLFFIAPQQIHSEQTRELEKAQKSLEARENPGQFLLRPGETVSVIVSPLIPDPNQKPADPDDLEFYFFTFVASAGNDYVQYANVTITNRSPRKMHIEMWGQIDYWKDNGETARYGLKAKWNPDGWKEGTGQEFVDLEPWETKPGRLVLFLGKPKENGISRWSLEAAENVYIDVFDSVTGKRVVFKVIPGYPSGQMPFPLPSHNQLLALEFPVVPKSDSQSVSTSENLDLLFRTRDLGFNSTKMGLTAMFRNNSPNRMELSVNLLGRSAQDENAWLTVEGLIEREGSSAERILIIEPDETAEGHLQFDLTDTGMTDPNSELSRLPKDTLLEIDDRISGKKIWCAIHPGYPPGADMRAFTILPHSGKTGKPSQESPRPNSGNPPVDEMN